ncbi:MAG: sugar ABC transporter ATP-binding protein [Lentisphaerae bacterium]|nr:sugar ABC transporter ATP-binding protein [Lentisphaerota bacterium]
MIPLLEMSGIGKRFGPVQVLRNASLEVRPGEIHALIGENGAGKSTLMNILSGVHAPDEGSVAFRGAAYRARSPQEARARGVATIFQETALAPHLTVEENATLGMERSARGFVRSRRAEVCAALDMLGRGAIDPGRPVCELSIAERQVVEIARALLVNAALLVMDEPTSSLSGDDTSRLFDVMRRLRGRGVAIVYISHFLEEIMQVADRFTVLRDGETVASGDVAETPIPRMVELMVGRKLAEMFPRVPHSVGEPRLVVRGLDRHPALNRVSFEARAGEILGIAGLVGSGRTELLRAIFGLDPVHSGYILIRGKEMLSGRRWTPVRALDGGLDLLSENRKEEGLAVELCARDNVSLSSLEKRDLSLGPWLRLCRERARAGSLCRRLNVRFAGLDQRARELSGGNQQKLAVARLLLRDSPILLLDEPTRGIDVASKVEIYRRIGAWAAEGRTIVMTSSHLPELLGICDSIAVMHRGRLSPVRPAAAWSEQAIMEWAVAGRDKDGG